MESKELNEDLEHVNQLTRQRVGIDTLERYTGSSSGEFQPYILLTNFKKYVDVFSERFDVPIRQGSAMRASHSSEKRMTIIDYGVGSPVAALVMELLSFIKPKATLMLGMCGGLREEQNVGDFFNPVAAIRGEGTSDSYLPPQVPALSSFVIQRVVCDELDQRNINYRSGSIHTTNVRFWEFNEDFRENLKAERVQAIDMECATLFTVGFAKQVPIGALMLISDLPLQKDGVKTKESAKRVFQEYTDLHIETGVAVFEKMQARETDGFNYQF